MDTNGKVIYLHSLSKTVFPSLRLGILVAGQVITYRDKQVQLSDLMAKVKGYITVNTSTINQSVFAGMLLKNDFSLRKHNEGKVQSIKKKRDRILFCLHKFFRNDHYLFNTSISWNIPQGGFFITVSLPFKVDKQEVLLCAEKYNLIVTPMSFFYFKDGGEKEVRLAFSNLPYEQIEPAIERLMTYIKSKLNNSIH
jgi:(S)-3,5-dihydroxyphenylglycine transaminase